MKAQRVVWGETLIELAHTDERVLVVDGDLATSTRADLFADTHPGRFIQGGIAEQNMVGVAFGLSTLGYRPWLSSFGVFLTNRALDQVRMLVSQTVAPVRLAAAYTGVLNGASGKTHHDIEDLAIMRAMPNMTVLAPADAAEARAVITWAAEHPGPVYLRLARDPVGEITPADYCFALGRPVRLSDGDAAVVVSTGVQSSRTAEAVAGLRVSELAVRHVHLPTIKPLDEARLLDELSGFDTVVTVEDHNVIGGLGELVSGALTGRGAAAQVHRIGLHDAWSESGPNDFLLDKYGLSAARVEATIRSAVGAPVAP